VGPLAVAIPRRVDVNGGTPYARARHDRSVKIDLSGNDFAVSDAAGYRNMRHAPCCADLEPEIMLSGYG
jgi:hypothetical protein